MYMPTVIQNMANVTSEDANLSAKSYTIKFSDSSSGSNCGSAMIQTSSCRDEFCSHAFEVSLSTCLLSVAIYVTAYGTNTYGIGPPSNEITISECTSFCVD